jgi:amino acid adenylation domain-containing protein
MTDPTRLDAMSAQTKRELLARLLKERQRQGESLFPLSHGQLALWFLHELAPRSAAYNVGWAARLRRPFDRKRLREALASLIARHPMLRVTFVNSGGTPTQRVQAAPAAWYQDVDAAGWTDDRLEREVADAVRRPFDLTRGPVFRAILFSRGLDDHVLLLVAHHIVVDAWSLSVLLADLSALCCSAPNAQAAPPPPVATYADFVRWQRRLLASKEGERLWEYWRKQLEGANTVLDLPTDRPRPLVQQFRGATHAFEIDKEACAAIKRLARAERTTAFAVMAAVFQVLLHRYSGQADLLLGSPLAGRPGSEFSSVVGYFVNTVVLRSTLTGRRSFRDLLGATREAVIGALRHGDYPFFELVHRLEPERQPSRAPLVQVMFNFLKSDVIAPDDGLGDGSVAIQSLGDLGAEPYPLHQQEGQFDLDLTVLDVGDAFSAVFKFDAALFDLSTVEQMERHFRRLLSVFLADPDTLLHEAPLFTAAEVAQLRTWNATRSDYPRDRCAYQLVESQAASAPDSVAVVCGPEALTYGELNARAEDLARRLRAAGVSSGERVAVCATRTVALPVSVLGVGKARAAYVPLDPSHPPERLAYMLSDSGVRVIVMDAATSESVPVPPELQVVNVFEGDPQPANRADVRPNGTPEDTAYVIYTSGSTGRPKGVQVPHRALVNLLFSVRRKPGFGAEDVLVAVTTVCFDTAGVDLWLPLVSGGRLVVAPQEVCTDGRALAGLLEQSGATMLQATPGTWRLLLASGWRGTPGLRILSTGEELPRELANRLLDCTHELWNLYGPTETTIWSSLWEVQAGDGPVLIGGPVGNTQLHILDGGGQEVPVGVTGEIYIGGDGVATGYLGRPDLTAERFLPDPFSSSPAARMYRTGDLARRRRDGQVVYLGRADDQVKLRGYRIELSEIEQVLRQHPAVTDAVVAVVERQPGDKRLVGYVLYRAADATAGGEDLRAHCATHLPEYMVPSHWVTLDAVPRTPNGKVDRRALPAPALEAEIRGIYEPPLGEIETKVAEAWKDVLGIDRVGRRDSFFDLGGHSLLAVRLANRIQSGFGVPLPLGIFFKNPTISGIVSWLEANSGSLTLERAGTGELPREEVEL